MKTNVKMGGNVKKMEQMSTSVYVRSDSPEKTVNVIITISVIRIEIKMNKILLNKIKASCKQSLH